MMNKKVLLSQPIANFYHASEIYDEELLSSCFAEDAILVDEGEDYRGSGTISGHIMKANRDANVKTEITNCVERNGEIIVTATISGNFEGSPIPLDFHFTLNQEKIKKLYIEVAD